MSKAKLLRCTSQAELSEEIENARAKFDAIVAWAEYIWLAPELSEEAQLRDAEQRSMISYLSEQKAKNAKSEAGPSNYRGSSPRKAAGKARAAITADASYTPPRKRKHCGIPGCCEDYPAEVHSR